MKTLVVKLNSRLDWIDKNKYEEIRKKKDGKYEKEVETWKIH